MKPVRITLPAHCAQRVSPEFVAQVFGTGETALLSEPLLGLIGSRECPGQVLLETLDHVPQWVKARSVIVSGFHSPLEQQVLRSVLRRKGRVIKVLARGLKPDGDGPRLPPEETAALREGRLLLISPFGPAVTRTTRATSLQRNRFVLTLSENTLVPHVSSGSPMEGLLREFNDRLLRSGDSILRTSTKT
jgi:predicted Rossmann fold nucleotide-binding protein DprA/Smf involved in DNA uptake